MRSNRRRVCPAVSGWIADGDAPGWCGAIRTRRACGLETNRSGGSRSIASPSTPTGTGAWESTSKAGSVHCCHPRCTATQDRHAENAVVHPRAGASTDDVPQPVDVVGHQDHRGTLVGLLGGVRPQQVLTSTTACAEHIGCRVENGAQLGVAVALLLHRLGIQPERHVVHEHAAVDLGQVDVPFGAVDEGVERAHHVVTIDTKIEGEVVAGARGDAGEGEIVLRSDGRNQRLGPVTASSGQGVGARRDRGSYDLLPVVAGSQLDGPDAAALRLCRQVVRDGFPSAGLGIPHDHGVARLASQRTSGRELGGRFGQRRGPAPRVRSRSGRRPAHLQSVRSRRQSPGRRARGAGVQSVQLHDA